MKIFLLSFILGVAFSSLSTAQVAVDKTTLNEDAVLDFPTGTTKGILLPVVQSLPVNPANGTFLLDASDNSKMKMYENGTWVDLTDQGNTSNANPPISYPGNATNTKTVMGEDQTNVDGVLVLESENKALVLPKIASPHLNVASPYPGMMCYDTDAKALAVFDGTEWSYWR